MILIQHRENLTQGEIGPFILYVLFVQDVKQWIKYGPD